MVDNLERLEATNLSLGRHVLGNGFGGTTPNSGTAYREWVLLTTGVLTVIGRPTRHLHHSHHGATETEMMAVINYASSFAGAPRAVNSMRRISHRLKAARSYDPQSEYIVRLIDHDAPIRDTKNRLHSADHPHPRLTNGWLHVQ
jgi:hypothetical protein